MKEKLYYKHIGRKVNSDRSIQEEIDTETWGFFDEDHHVMIIKFADGHFKMILIKANIMFEKYKEDYVSLGYQCSQEEFEQVKNKFLEDCK